MEAGEIKQKVFDLLMEQPTLSMATDQEFADIILNKFGKIVATRDIATARDALKVIPSKADIEAIPRPEADTLGQVPVTPTITQDEPET